MIMNRKTSLFVVSMLAIALPTMATAQQVSAASQEVDNGVGGLEEITVTARRTKENLEKIPLAVSVLSGDAIREQQLTAPQDLNSKVPSLSVGTSNANRDSSIYTIRGQGEAFGGSEPGVITYFAEVPTNITGPGVMFDLQNVQVLKGPQGTLFGRNTTGGAILLEPQRPTNEVEGYVDATGGNYDQQRLQAALNIPMIDDKLLIRGAVDINRRDGFTRDAVTGVEYDNRHYDAYRFSVLARPWEGLENYLVFNRSVSNTHGAGTVLLAVDPTSLAAQLLPLVAALQQQQARGPRVTAHSTPGPFDLIISSGLTNITSWNVSDHFTVKNIFGYRTFREQGNVDIDGSAIPLIDYVRSGYNLSGSSSQPSDKAYSDEFQVLGKVLDDRLSWVLGAYSEWIDPYSSTDKDEIIEFGAGPFILQSLKTDRSKAAFGQFDYDLSRSVEGLKITGGMRYTDDSRKQQSSQYFIDPTHCNLTNGGPNCTESERAKFHAITWNVSVQYQITPSTLVYLASRKGYKSGGFNTDTPVPQDSSFGPEYVQDGELGLKMEFNSGGVRGRLNADVYRGKFTHIQETAEVYDAAHQSQTDVTLNLGTGIIQGVELEATLIPTDWLNWSAFYAFTDAHYTENSYPGPTGPVDVSHLPFSNTPKNKAGLSARVARQVGKLGEFALSANVAYQSRVEFLIPIVPNLGDTQFGQNGYSLVNVRADWKDIAGRPIDFGVFVTNATNKLHKIFETNFYPTPVGITSGIYGEPRMIGAEIRYRFGK
jgi:iron complex outermembrane receptor protein